MKRFIKYLLIFVLPILIIGISSEYLLRKIPNDYGFKSEYLKKNSNDIQVLFLGSSHSFYGLNPEYIKSRSFNAAYVSQYLNYDLAIFKKYNWKNLKFIVLPIDYFSLFGTLEDGSEAWRKRNYNIYYDIRMDRSISDDAEVFNSLKLNIHKLYSYYYLKKSNITSSNLGWGTTYSSKDTQNLVTTGRTAAKRHTINNDQYLNRNLGDLKSIIESAKAKNVRVFLFTSPAYRTYTENLNKKQLTRTYDYIVELTKHYDNVAYYNLLNDSSFRSIDFFDADHLNEIGAKKLTLKIDSLLSAIGSR